MDDNPKEAAKALRALDSLGAGIPSSVALTKLVNERHPLRKLRVIDRDELRDGLNRVERDAVDKMLAEYEKVRDRAMGDFLDRAEAAGK